MSNVSTASWTASAQRLTQPVVSALNATAQIFQRVAIDVYHAFAAEPYKNYFANRGFTPCRSTYPLLCYTQNTPGREAQERGPLPGGRGERYYAAIPEVSRTAVVNLVSGAVLMTTCTDRTCEAMAIDVSPKLQMPRVKSQVAAVEELDDDERAGSVWRQRY